MPIQKIENFIHRRFSQDCHWTDGNCYWFARILEEAFPQYFPKICYWQIIGHFTCYFAKLGLHFDYNGVYYSTIKEDYPQFLSDIENADPALYAHLKRDCML